MAGLYRDSDDETDGEYPWRDRERLHQMYIKDKMSMGEIADELDCGQTTVRNWLNRHDIPTRSIKEAKELEGDPVPFWTRKSGHENWCPSLDGGDESPFVYVHRLAAMAWFGVEETADAGIVHHKNDVPWDNREENLALLRDRSEHMEVHRKVDGLDRLRIAELYENGDISTYKLADMVDHDISYSTVRYIHKEFFGGDSGA